jgi:histone-lysine N-methyltransferase SETMAR
VKQFLASKSICVIQHPRYSPDLTPADFFLFPKLKLALKGERFGDISDVQSGLTEQLKGTSLQDLQRVFKDMYKRSQRCVELWRD